MAISRTSDQFLLDAYSGQGGFSTGDYLVAHPRESSDKLLKRKELAVYPNFTRKIVDVMLGFLWKQNPNRESDDLYKQFSSNADGAGTKIDSLMFVYQRLAMILGTIFVIVDKPTSQGKTMADQAYPYLAIRLKSQLISEIKDSSGVWQSVTFSENRNDQTVYRTFTLTGWTLSSKKDGSDIIESGEYKLNRVPVVRFHIAKPLNPTDTSSSSWVYDLAQLNWDLYNQRSELRELFRSQTFAVLAIPVSDSTEMERLKDLTIGTDNALSYNPNGGGQPGYIAPPPDPVQLYLKLIEATVSDIYKVANLEFVGGVQQSGVALSFHFQEANSGLRGMAEMSEIAENEIARLVYLWQGREFNGSISYPNDFNMTDLKDALANAMDSVSLGLGEAFDKALKKRTAQQMLGNDVSPQVMAEIENDIDNSGDIYANRLQSQAVTGG